MFRKNADTRAVAVSCAREYMNLQLLFHHGHLVYVHWSNCDREQSISSDLKKKKKADM